MVLEEQSTARHNCSMSERIPHPPSTRFDEDEFKTPIAKRQKRRISLDSSIAREEVVEEIDNCEVYSPLTKPEIPDSDSDDCESDEEAATGHSAVPTSRTDLESVLPLIKTDKEAIADYEASRAAEAVEASNLSERLYQRKWVRGKTSIYVDAFNLALQTVLEEESHLFNEAELVVFRQWEELSYEAQYLYVRLFLRKTATWHRVNRLRYYGDISDLQKALTELFEERRLPGEREHSTRYPGEVDASEGIGLGQSFAFADSSQDHITSMDEASSLLMLDELKALAKDIKVQGKTKKELLNSIRRTSQQQSGLGWKGLKRSDTEESVKSEASASSATLEDNSGNRDSHFVQKILANTGDCVRLSSAPQKLFERVHLVFYRSTEWTEKSLTTIILSRISRKNFPDYIVSRSTNIFVSRPILLEFEASIRTQFKVDSILEFNGPVTIAGLKQVQAIADEVYPRWRELLAEEQEKEDRTYESGEGAYLRRFSPAWVYTRIIHKGLGSLARFKEHEREHELLTELLQQHLFHAARRGAWYQRKALVEEHYMWALTPSEGRSDDAQKRHWKQTALRTCEQGLQDRDCHLIYHYDLQKRITKLEKTLKVAKRLQHDFAHVLLAKPVERTVEGIRLERESTATPPPHRRTSSPGTSAARRGGKTVWVDEHESGGECSVEEMCLSHYRHVEGWKGWHSEGRVVRTLFGFLFYDVLFAYVPNVFQTPFQTCPLDLHSDAFYPARFSEIQHLLARISNGDGPAIFRDVYARLAEKETCVVGVRWDYGREDLEEIVDCIPGKALAALCHVMAQEYSQRGGGIPDLFLWRKKAEGSGEIMFAEVKSENDHLSDTQRLWIHVLTGAGVRVELCNAVAREVKKIR